MTTTSALAARGSLWSVSRSRGLVASLAFAETCGDNEAGLSRCEITELPVRDFHNVKANPQLVYQLVEYDKAARQPLNASDKQRNASGA